MDTVIREIIDVIRSIIRPQPAPVPVPVPVRVRGASILSDEDEAAFAPEERIDAETRTIDDTSADFA